MRLPSAVRVPAALDGTRVRTAFHSRRVAGLPLVSGADRWIRINDHSVSRRHARIQPGGTAARNVDNSNNLITNPETADRGPYTEFHGYFYAGKSVIIV